MMTILKRYMLLHMHWLLFVFPLMLQGQHKEIDRLKALLPHVKDSVAYVNALNRLAVLYQACQLDSCGHYASRAREVATRINYPSGKARALRNLGNYYAFRPHHYLSYLFYNDALEESRHAGDSISVSQVLMSIGIYHQYTGKHTSANDYIHQSLQLTRQLKQDSLHALGLASYYTVNYADPVLQSAATAALKEATALARRFHDTRELLYINLLLVNEDFAAGRFEIADHLLRQVIDTALKEGYTYFAMYGSLQLAAYKSWLHQADSIKYQQDAVSYGVAGGYAGLLLPQVTQLYQYFQQKKDTLQAARYSRIALNIMQQRQDDMQQGEMDYIAYSLQDQMLDSLKMQSALQQTALQKTRLAQHYWQYLFIFIVVIILLLLVLTYYLIRSYRSSRLRSQRLARIRTEISAANEVLKTNDDFKNKLISLIAHDFRTPLYNIIDITGFVNEDILTPEDAAGMVMEVEHTATATLKVFEEILSWMRTQLSGFVYRPRSFGLTDMLGASVQSIQHLVREKNIRLLIHIPEGMTIQGDFEMLQFIHRNFLHNAIKFSPENGAITITAIRRSDFVEVTFRDEGPGIDPVILPGLFTYSSDGYTKKRYGKGAGLALIICRDFIDKMSGEAGAANNEEGGSTFFYRVPEINL
ncbi:sensor histidine kinase [Chitinophaga flava]|uniref:histidine kinase n=1 Tax=Chitinophaga flava TaxID=2259036 RepID=A0A365Y1Y9_9BACT|nr:HAMP domain-containing sensor histidine kinase [Chitinophaga flava]RBL92629.1 hypothetical protein DF182_08640 [Chitinophaga flava]